MAALISLLVLVLASAVAVYQLTRGLGRSGGVATSLILLGFIGGVPGLLFSPVLSESPERVDLSNASYETSVTCRKCHEARYQSWHATFHRTMTQEAASKSVLGNFENTLVTFNGLECYLGRDGDRFFMNLVNPRWESLTLQAGRLPRDDPNPPRVTYPVDRTVGSHNMQAYLTRFPNGQYQVLPLMWHMGENRWITRGGGFLKLTPEHLYTDYTPWNTSCAFCHNTKANPGMRLESDSRDGAALNGVAFETHLAEMGISCESCHGPGETHVAANQNPVRRYYLSQTDRQDPTIVNPAALPKELAIEACGRCHGKWAAKPEFQHQWDTQGDFFIPGGERLAKQYSHSFAFPGEPVDSIEPDPNYFWPDWTPRPSAMEYQGMLLSECYQQGELTCSSCHSMHDYTSTNDQLRFPDSPETPPAIANQSCVACHDQFASGAAVSEHTHHPADSTASVCDNCHMPYQAYGLLKAIRTHRIANPQVGVSARTRLPNACNQCHIDRSLAWTAEWMARWYDQPVPELSRDQKTLSTTILELNAGHCLNRFLAASRMGWSPAREAAPGDWPVPFLIGALDDSYAAVRLVAYQSLRRFAGFEDLQFDYLGDLSVRREQVNQARLRWRQIELADYGSFPPTVPLQSDGQPVADTIDRLLEIQDPAEIVVFE